MQQITQAGSEAVAVEADISQVAGVGPGRWRLHRQHHLGARGLADAGQLPLLPLQGRHAHAHPQPGVELGPHGIRVVGVGPGAVDTPINAATKADPAKLAALTAAIPLGRIGTPADIASLVVFIASDLGSYLTSATVVADGGITQGSVGL